VKVNGFRSKLEERLWKHRPKRRGLKSSYESESIPYTLTRKYLPDFIFSSARLGKIYIEAKGWFRNEDKAKMRAVKKCNPHLDIRMVFASKKEKDIAWCVKNGFPYAIGRIPSEWFQEDDDDDTPDNT